MDPQEPEVIIVQKEITRSEIKNWSMACHLSALVGFLIPLGALIGPLVVWLMKRDEMVEVAEQGRDSLNFQLTMLIAYVVSFVLVFIGIGLLLLPLVGLFSLVMIIIATVKASEGKRFIYPLSLQLIK